MAENNSKHKNTAPGQTYTWNNRENTTLRQHRDVLEMRREDMLAAASTSGITDEMKEEWCELLMERDVVLRELLKQENEQKLQYHFISLLQLLVTIGQFDHSATPDKLKAALYSLYTELLAHESDISSHQNNEDESDEENMAKTTTTIPTPPPPPPPVMSSCFSEDKSESMSETAPLLPVVTPTSPKRLRLDESDLEDSLRRPRSRRRKVSTTRSPLTMPVTPKYLHRSRAHAGSKYTPRVIRTPKSAVAQSEDLRRSILSGKDNLKSTPDVKRSPGGTPQRLARNNTFSDNPGDILSVALQKKFFNVRRLYASPVKDDDQKTDSREASFNLSID